MDKGLDFPSTVFVNGLQVAGEMGQEARRG
jgi:hypothetical protein